VKRNRIALLILLFLIPVVVSADDGDQPTENTAWEWRAQLDEFAAPVFGALIEARTGMEGAQVQVCGMTDTDFVASDDPLTIVGVDTDPTVRETAWMLGQSLGRPIGYVRALQQSNNIRISFVNPLIWFLLASITWIIFIWSTSILILSVRFAVETVVYLYKLIPFI
jgi:hypothetical protein